MNNPLSIKVPPSKMSSRELSLLIKKSGVLEQRLFPRKVPSIALVSKPTAIKPPVSFPDLSLDKDS